MNEIAVDGKRVNFIRTEANKVLDHLIDMPIETQKVILELALADTKGRLAKQDIKKFENSYWVQNGDSVAKRCDEAYKTYLNHDDLDEINKRRTP